MFSTMTQGPRTTATPVPHPHARVGQVLGAKLKGGSGMDTLETIAAVAAVYVLVFIAHRASVAVDRPTPDDSSSY